MLKPDLEGVSFLVGRWDSGEGKVLDVGGSAATQLVSKDGDAAAIPRRDP